MSLLNRKKKAIIQASAAYVLCCISGLREAPPGASVLAQDSIRKFHSGVNTAWCCTGHFMGTSRTAFLHDRAEQACGCRVSSCVQPPWGTPFKQHKLM